MDDLKTLIEAVAKLPQMAIWVVVMFWAYKVVVIGSIYGLIRFIVSKAHDYATKKKTEKPVDIPVRLMLDGECISGAKEQLIIQLQRIKRSTGAYVHNSDVEWLARAIDDKIGKDLEEAKVKANPLRTA